MGHAVHHRDRSGDIHLDEVDSLDDALALVERLRNEEDATDVRVFREVPIEVRTYYRVVAVEAEPDMASNGDRGVSPSSFEPPAGAMPLSPPPPSPGVPEVDPAPEVSTDEQPPPTEQRRALFSRT